MENLAKSNQKIAGEPKPVFGKSDKGKSQQTIGGKNLKVTAKDSLVSKPLPPDHLFGDDNIRRSQKGLKEAQDLKKPDKETIKKYYEESKVKKVYVGVISDSTETSKSLQKKRKNLAQESRLRKTQKRERIKARKSDFKKLRKGEIIKHKKANITVNIKKKRTKRPVKEHFL